MTPFLVTRCEDGLQFASRACPILRLFLSSFFCVYRQITSRKCSRIQCSAASEKLPRENTQHLHKAREIVSEKTSPLRRRTTKTFGSKYKQCVILNRAHTSTFEFWIVSISFGHAYLFARSLSVLRRAVYRLVLRQGNPPFLHRAHFVGVVIPHPLSSGFETFVHDSQYTAPRTDRDEKSLL